MKTLIPFKKNALRLSLILLIALTTVCCQKNDNDEVPPLDYKVGDVLYSEFGCDEKPIETVEEVFTDFGTTDSPAYFMVATKHEIEGTNVLGKFRSNGVYHAVSKEQLSNFIFLFAKQRKLLNETATENEFTEKQKAEAYKNLYKFLSTNKIDIGVMVRLVQDNQTNIAAMDRLIEAHQSNMSKSLDSEQTTNSYLNHLYKNEISLESALAIACQPSSKIETRGVTKIIKLVIDGAVALSKVIIKLIDICNTTVDMKSTYGAYMDEGVTDPAKYYGGQNANSGEYYFRYGTSGTPMIECKFKVFYYNQARLEGSNAYYISQVGVTIIRAKTGSGKSLVGNVTFAPGAQRAASVNNQDAQVAVAKVTFDANYYDLLKICNRYAQLQFEVDALDGYKQLFWDNQL